MSKRSEKEVANAASPDAFLDTGGLAETIRTPQGLPQLLGDGGNYGNSGEEAEIALSFRQASPRPSVPPRLLCVTEKTRTTPEVHPGWVRATGILLKGLARLEATNEHTRSAGGPAKQNPPT